MSWKDTKKIKEVIADEISLVPQKHFKSVPVNVALAYPNSYEICMSNLGFQTIYQQLNMRDDCLCHRAFDLATKILTLESMRAIGDYDILGFSVSFEMDYLNILKTLQKSNIALFAKDRDKPLVMAGGPAVTFNPEPLSPFIDFFVIGEGEEVIHEIIDAYKNLQHLSKQKILEGLAQIEGVYVPLLHTDNKVRRRWIKNIDKFNTESVILTPNTEFGNMFLIEIARGCGRNCRFCMAGYCYRIPRARSLDKILERAEFGAKLRQKIGLVGAAVSDYPQIDELSERLIRKNIKFSVSSLRADTLREPLMRGLAASGHKTLTIAPEAGSERLRAVINKGIAEEDIIRAIKLAHKFNIENIKLYYIIGLPTETDDDIEEMIDFVCRIKEFMQQIGNKYGQLTVSVNPFVPKPFTPFQWYGMESMEKIKAKLSKLQSQLKPRGIKLLFDSPREAEIQAALARGDRLTGLLLYEVFKLGGKTSAYKKVNIEEKNFAFYAHRSFSREDVLPWEHIDIGLDKSYFLNEYKKAQKGEFTRQCTADICETCKICRK